MRNGSGHGSQDHRIAIRINAGAQLSAHMEGIASRPGQAEVMLRDDGAVNLAGAAIDGLAD